MTSKNLKLIGNILLGIFFAIVLLRIYYEWIQNAPYPAWLERSRSAYLLLMAFGILLRGLGRDKQEKEKENARTVAK